MKKFRMTHTILFILAIAIGLFYALKYGEKAKKEIAAYESDKDRNDTDVQEWVTLPYFGKIAIQNTEAYTDVIASIGGNEVSLDLNFDEVKISKKKLQPTIDFLDRLTEHEKIAKEQLRADFNKGEVVKGYINHHLEELTDEELNLSGIQAGSNSTERMQQFLENIHLKRIGFYPEYWDSMVIFDFTINEDFTQYLIVLKFDSRGNLVDISTES